jgi:hypothetical protein
MDDQQPQDTDVFTVPVNRVATTTPEEEYIKPDHQILDHTTPDTVVPPAPSQNFSSMNSFNFPATETTTPEIASPTISERAATVSNLYPSLEPAKPEPVTTLPPSAPTNYQTLTMPHDDRPVPVVKVLSVRGVEYAMMSMLLWFGAGSLIFTLISIINGFDGFDALAFPIAMLLVCLPGFGYLFLRLRKAELDDPSLRLEASKRRLTQITQILAFLTCFFNIVTVVYLLLGVAGGNEIDSIGKVLGSAAVVLLVAGGILYYYWVDEHKLVGKR